MKQRIRRRHGYAPKISFWLVLLCVFITLYFMVTRSSKTTTAQHLSSSPLSIKDISIEENSVLSQSEKDNFFDCAHQDSLCRYFHPQTFFQSSLPSKDEREYKRIGGLNSNLPACTGLVWWEEHEKLKHQDLQKNKQLPLSNNDDNFEYDYIPHNLTFVHMHKCGGSSVKSAMYDLSRRIVSSSSSISNANSLNDMVKRISYATAYKHAFGASSTAQKLRNDAQRESHIQSIELIQQEHYQPVSFPVFTIIRHPIERFVSAIAQVMQYNDDLREKCLKSTPRDTIACAIQDIDETSYRRDVHLVPMATHLRLFNEYNITVSVFDISDIKDVLQYLGLMPDTERHVHDRSDVKFAKSEVLSKLSMDDCTKEMKEEICKLYEVDVLMLRNIGFEVSHCI
uniref:Sulfotransferase domain-containing protein n=1 Tax=Ditylum brightwellii TaxID=49249 RepID=A0A6V2A7H8_9STRA